MINHLRATVSVLLALALALASVPAWALGLGQIEVKSQRDQPLVADIPVISSDPGELQALQARLASPETFARIGLPQPQGIVSDLQFAVAVDERGRPVIRVTSAAPVQQPLLTFLVEVDWGQGRLVREYSALLDTPQTAAAPLQPSIEEAVVAEPNNIIRLPEPDPTGALAAETPTPLPLPDDPSAEPAPPSRPDPLAAARPEPVAIPAPRPEPEPAPVQPAAPRETASAGTLTVRRGDTLGGIAAGLGGQSLDQTLVALLRANPDAFIGGNVHRLKAGAVLRIPDANTIASYSAEEASMVVREQTAQWRGARRPLPQPPAVVGAPAGPRNASAQGGTESGARRSTQARLEIMPPSASDAQRAGTRSGVNAGGEGEMLRQQEMQETRETLAARSAEVEELKLRVAELEKLQQQQQQLLEMKDSELAAAQQRLGTQQTTDNTTISGFGPWLGVGAGLLIIGLLTAWWFSRRAAKNRPVFDADALASAAPVDAPSNRDANEGMAAGLRRRRAARDAARDDEIDPVPASVQAVESAAHAQDDVAFDAAFVETAAVETPAVDPARSDAAAGAALPAEPAWNRLAKNIEIPTPRPVTREPTGDVPTWHAGGAGIAPLNPAPAGHSRIDLARAYLNMGDRDTARSLLREVAEHGDSAALRLEASRMLDDLI